MNPVELVLHKGPIFSNVMFVEKIGSVGRWFVLLVWGGKSLVSTRLAMSSSWISVMQAAVDDLLLMTQILFVVGRSSIDHIFFFFISGSLLDLLPFLVRVVHEVNLNFLGF